MEAPKLIRDFQVRVSEVHFNRKLNLTALADYLQGPTAQATVNTEPAHAEKPNRA